jgi:putative hydrolase of the HAD superfamily
MTVKKALFNHPVQPLKPIPTGVLPDLANMQHFSAMLFDVYGTLLISAAGEIGRHPWPAGRMDAIEELLKRYDMDPSAQPLLHTLVQRIEHWHGMLRNQGVDCPEVDIVQIWRQVLGMDDVSVVKAFAAEFEWVVNPVFPMPGFKELVSACNSGGIRMGLISNAQFYTIDTLERFLGASLEKRGFDQRLLFFSWREGHAKPSPVMFNRAKAALSDMGIAATRVLYVGNDLKNDILPAMAAGFKAALFAGDRRSLRPMEFDDRCSKQSPDLIVTDLRQLIAATVNPQP